MTTSDDKELLDVARKEEEQWVQHASSTLDLYDDDSDELIAWSAHHASKQPCPSNAKAVTAMMPLLTEKSAEPAMVKHGLDVVRNAVDMLNPGQIPVISVDQPIYAIAKSIQWKWPDLYGESVDVIMLSGLHIEMALWRMLGDLLVNSGSEL